MGSVDRADDQRADRLLGDWSAHVGGLRHERRLHGRRALGHRLPLASRLDHGGRHVLLGADEIVRRRLADSRRQRAERGGTPGDGAGEHPGDLDRPAAGHPAAVELAVGPQLRWRSGDPSDPGVEDGGGRPPGPLEREEGDRRGNGTHPEVERGHDAEIPAAAAPAGPVQILVLLRPAPVQHAVGRHDVDHGHLVTRQPVGAGKDADAPAQGQPGDAHRRARSSGQQEPLRCQVAVHVDQLGARTHRDDPLAGSRAAIVASMETPCRRDTSITRPGPDEYPP